MKLILPVVCVLIMVGCGKKSGEKNKKLAKNYFKSALLELTGDSVGTFAHKKALTWIDKALLEDNQPMYSALKATLLFKIGDQAESFIWFKKALDLCSEPAMKAEIKNNYACLLAEQGKVNEAKLLLQQLIADRHYLTPEVALVNLGKIALEQGDTLVAQQLFQQAITLAPQYVDAHFYLVCAARKNNNDLLVRQELATLSYLKEEKFMHC